MRKPSSPDHFFCPAVLVWPGDPEPLEWRRNHPDAIRVPVTVRGATPRRHQAATVPATPGEGSLPAFELPKTPSLSEFGAIRTAAGQPPAPGGHGETELDADRDTQEA